MPCKNENDTLSLLFAVTLKNEERRKHALRPGTSRSRSKNESKTLAARFVCNFFFLFFFWGQTWRLDIPRTLCYSQNHTLIITLASSYALGKYVLLMKLPSHSIEWISEPPEGSGVSKQGRRSSVDLIESVERTSYPVVDLRASVLNGDQADHLDRGSKLRDLLMDIS